MKKGFKNNKGVTLTALVVTVTAMMILTSVILYNAKSDLVINKLQTMKMDVANIRGKVENYYAQYGALPIIDKEIPQEVIGKMNSSIFGVNDYFKEEIPSDKSNPETNGNNTRVVLAKFYVIKLSSLENLTLTYGKDYSKVENDFNALTQNMDVYIINEKSHNIYYLKGVNIDGKVYYTDFTENEIDTKTLELVPIKAGTSVLPGHISNQNGGYVDNSDNKVYIPKGFSIVPGCENVSNGLVISDDPTDTEEDKNNIKANGNQFVWIPVKDINDFKRQNGYYYDDSIPGVRVETRDYRTSEASLTKNTLVNEDVSVLNEANRMYKSVEKYGGFYIGRYEAGLDYKRGETDTDVPVPFSKKNKKPYVNIPWSNSNDMSNVKGGAVEAARSMYPSNNDKYGAVSTLCYDVQWDAALNFIDNNYITNTNKETNNPNCSQDSVIYNSTGKGNYNENANTNPKKGNIIDTGSYDEFKINNIYDMAGNVWEWTMECFYNDKRTRRGGDYMNIGSCNPISNHNADLPYTLKDDKGFRVCIYIYDKNNQVDTLPSTDDTKPFLPEGAIQIPGTNLDNGLTIQDDKGNEWVWIEVPKSIYINNTYNNNGANKPSGPTDYAKIEAVMHKYVEVYRKGKSNKDIWYSESQNGLTENEYYALKNKMLKSVYENGGFYIGKYEVGIQNSYRSKNLNINVVPDEIPVIKEGVYPYNWVTNKQAQQKVIELSTGGKTSSLMFGVQWDLVLKHIETKNGKNVSDLNQKSTLWGNYTDAEFDISRGKYLEDGSNLFINVTNKYHKNPNKSVLMTTGATSRNSVLNIYDLSGNVYEWTLEYTLQPSYPCVTRGGGYYSNGYEVPASARGGDEVKNSFSSVGFRSTLY